MKRLENIINASTQIIEKTREMIPSRSEFVAWGKRELPDHVVNSSAQLTLATPIFALYEISIANMDVNQSFNTRCWAAGITLAGVGYLDAKVRGFVRNRLSITDDTEESRQR